MFDIGFSEMLVIAVVALIVIGPERLPKVARTVGLLFGRMQRYVNDVKSDISREMELDELRKLQATVEDAARAIEADVKTGISGTEMELNKIATDASAPFNELQAPPAEPVAATHASEEPVAPAATETAAAPQLELGLESAQAPQSSGKPA